MTIYIPTVIVAFFVIFAVIAILLAFAWLLMLEWTMVQRRLPKCDDLTGLYTRGSIKTQICHCLGRINRLHRAEMTGRISDSFFLLDLDCFKQINDTYGHPCGDDLLSCVANILLNHTRPTGLVGRMGGDEFILFFTHMQKQEDIQQKADTLLQDIRNMVKIHPEWDGVTASIGIALTPQNGTSFEELYCKADAALYQAKQNGRDQTVFYQDTPDPSNMPNTSPG